MARCARFVYFPGVLPSFPYLLIARFHRLSLPSGFVLLVLGVLGCVNVAGPPPLLPHASVAPDGIDLSGRWLLRDAAADPLMRFSQQNVAGPGASTDALRIARDRQGVLRLESGEDEPWQAALAQVFLETGSDVKLTQTGEGLFISYDRSVVEEYLFGEYRTASIGPVSAERASGWDGSGYVVQTRDEDGVLLTERWYLEDGTLKRDVAFSEDEVVQYAVTQSFDRAPSAPAR